MEKNELRKIHKVENTPFNVVENETGCQIVMGNNLMCNKIFKTNDEAQKWIHTKPWELIIPAAAIIAQTVYNDLQTIKK